MSVLHEGGEADPKALLKVVHNALSSNSEDIIVDAPTVPIKRGQSVYLKSFLAQ